MRKIGILAVVFLMSFGAFAQLPNKVKKMTGTWEYKFRSGYEVFELNGDELTGVGYRINQKSTDTSRVETIRIRMANKNLVYSMTTYNVVQDSVVASTHQFVSSGKRMKFQNISAPTPYMIRYSFGFLNKNKLFIRVYHGPEAKPIKLILTRKDND
jgi:hypothetical protein